MDKLIKEAVKVPNVPKGASAAERLRIEQGRFTVDEALLKPIKLSCKTDPAQIDEAKRYLFFDIFSKKSSKFRNLVCDNIREILKCGSLIDAPLLNPSSRDNGIVYLERQILHTLELWDVQFGHSHPTLRATARYLRESLKKKMPNVAQKAREFEEQRKRREVAQSRVTKARRAQVFSETSLELPELEEDVRKMEEYFDMLVPDLTNLMSNRVLASAMASNGTGTGTGTGTDSGSSSNGGSADVRAIGRKRAREEEAAEDEDEDEDVAWEEDDTGGEVGRGGGEREREEDVVGRMIVTERAPTVDTLALDPSPIVISLHRHRQEDMAGEGEGGGNPIQNGEKEARMDAEITQIMRKHALYLAKTSVPRLQRWQDALVAAKTTANNSILRSNSGRSGTAAVEDRDRDAGEVAASLATGALLRKVAILNARLRRLLLGRCEMKFPSLQLSQILSTSTGSG